ncbi:MAG TPA: TonB-dependent receptor plug domain-containing protein, partial [Gammaproteobacteria bacterium]
MDGNKLWRGGACAALILLSAHLPAACALDQADSLADLSLQELADLPVTSVSKRPEPLADAAASVYVISNDDIRRSGARNLPEALRLAPNLEVGQATASNWAISARGSNETYADKLLILIDGRIIYNPIFSGTYWDVENVMLEDVDRIEVISGPGGTLWGTNAVNGVINIITKKSRHTRGTLASAGGGRLGADADVRYGGGSDDAAYRVYALYKDNYSSDTAAGVPQPDGLQLGQAGFRSDWNRAGHEFTLQGDAYAANEEQALPGPGQASGFNLLGRWDHALSGGSDLSLLAYYDHAQRSQPHDYDDTLDITDIELQQTLPALGEHSLTWGASYRYAWDAWRNYPGWALTFYPASARQAWTSLFGQDQIQLTQTWRLIGGARLERGP